MELEYVLNFVELFLNDVDEWWWNWKEVDDELKLTDRRWNKVGIRVKIESYFIIY